MNKPIAGPNGAPATKWEKKGDYCLVNMWRYRKVYKLEYGETVSNVACVAGAKREGGGRGGGRGGGGGRKARKRGKGIPYRCYSKRCPSYTLSLMKQMSVNAFYLYPAV